jgi:glycosyltransferase involved in cell wall biosynthesis
LKRLDDDRPLVSVLTPSFNQGRFVADCIRSVANQTYRPIEHIISDGGSEDGTLDVLLRAPRTVTWVSEADRGQSHALNKSFSRSTGEIIGWLNSDDAYFDPEAIASVVELFRRHPEVDVVYGHAALANAAGEILHFMWAPPFNFRLLRTTNFIVQPTGFVRRRALGDSVVDEAYEHSMDRELWLRLAQAYRFKRVDRVLAIDRHHPDRKVYTRRDLALADEQRLIQSYRIRPNRRSAPFDKVYRIGARFLGLRLLAAAFRPHACDLRAKGVAQLVLRQVAMPRRAMPIDAERSDH